MNDFKNHIFKIKLQSFYLENYKSILKILKIQFLITTFDNFE